MGVGDETGEIWPVQKAKLIMTARAVGAARSRGFGGSVLVRRGRGVDGISSREMKISISSVGGEIHLIWPIQKAKLTTATRAVSDARSRCSWGAVLVRRGRNLGKD